MEQKETNPKINETLEGIKRQVSDLQQQGYEALDIIYSDSPDHPADFGGAASDPDQQPTAGGVQASLSPSDVQTISEAFLDDSPGFGYTSSVDKAYQKIAGSINPDARHETMVNFDPNKSNFGKENPLFERTIIPVNHPDVGTPGKGYIPWGFENKLPNFIYQTSRSLPYTARSLQFLRDQIVGLGVEYTYCWTRYVGGTATTKEIPYKDAGVLIRGRIMELEEARVKANGGNKLIVNMINLDGGGQPKPGTVEYELQQLRQDYATWERVNAEVREFEENNNLYKHQLACMEDFVPLEMYLPLLGLSQGEPSKDWEPKIVSLRHISCCAGRLEEMDEERNINYVYYSDRWRTNLGFGVLQPKLNEIVAYPALPETGTKAFLRKIVDKKKKVGVRSRPTWFCMPRRMPCMNSLYYPVPYWWSIYTSAVYDYATTIIADRASARMNSTMWGKIIMVNHAYMERLWAANSCDNVDKKKAFRKKFKENIDNFLKNRANNGSTVMFESVSSPEGTSLWESVKIIDVPINTNIAAANKTELAEVSNVIFLAMGIHSVLMGNEINASSSTGGTVQRELDLLTQKHLAPMQKDYLDLLNFIRNWNDWDPEHAVYRSKQMSLTTLDASKSGTTPINNEGEKT